MKTIIKINNRGIGNYDSIEIKIKNPNNIIPREGERIMVEGNAYDVKNIFYDFDKGKVVVTVL